MNRLVEVREGWSKARLKEYAKLTPGAVARATRLAAGLGTKRILHVNATPVGGGVVEILRSQIPLERSLGIDSRWLAIEAEPAFFVVTKKMHNLFQGKLGRLTRREREVYLRVNRDLAASLREFMARTGMDDGILVIHDPQPLAILDFMTQPSGVSPILRMHIDFTTANPDIVRFFKPYIAKYRRVILSSSEYVRAFPRFRRSGIDIIQPAIDPFSDKNRTMPLPEAMRLLARYGIDGRRPILTQVSRFDPWKGPLGVVEAFRLARRRVPGLQLVIAGLMAAKDDPEAAGIYAQVKRVVGSDPDVHLFADPKQLLGVTNDRFINALLTSSTAVIQNSTREGFGLTMTEAMWHGKPLIAGRTTGARLQIVNGRNGLLISSPAQAARHMLGLLGDARLRRRLGTAAKASVRRRFLLSRYVSENLAAYRRASPKWGKYRP